MSVFAAEPFSSRVRTLEGDVQDHIISTADADEMARFMKEATAASALIVKYVIGPLMIIRLQTCALLLSCLYVFCRCDIPNVRVALTKNRFDDMNELLMSLSAPSKSANDIEDMTSARYKI